MLSLLVFAFTDEGGAAGMIADMRSLQKQQLIHISDAAIVVRKPDGKIKIRQAYNLVGKGALGGAFWGMLISVLFSMPWIGMPAGTVIGAMAGNLTDYGINDRFIKEVRVTIRPGQSALLLMVTRMTEDRVIEAVSRHRATLLRTNLSEEDENKLGEAFGAAEVEG